MGYGIGAYEYHVYGINDNYFEDVMLYAARGETLINPLIFILLSENKIYLLKPTWLFDSPRSK